MKTRTPYYMHCDWERLAIATYDQLRATYHPHIRQMLDQELRRHCVETLNRHWQIYPLSLQPTLWTAPAIRKISRDYTIEEEIMFRKLRIWGSQHTYARYLGYDCEEEFIKWITRDFRHTLWQATWKTRPRT